jgi:hypothetical protein
MQIILLLLFVFIGYATGRIGHIVGGELNKKGIDVKYWPHHWVFGAIAIVIGVFLESNLRAWLIAFGIGHIVSDLNDLLKGRVFDATQEPEIKKFWGTD